MSSLLNSRIIFRADGNNQLGLGHIYRCISMIQMLAGEFDCLFITNNPDNKVIDLIRGNCTLHIIFVRNRGDEIVALKGVLSADDIFVIDGYDFDTEYQKQIKQRVKKLVMIDDMAQMHFFADVVINHGGAPLINIYKKEKRTTLLTGFNYLIVRNEFLQAARKPRKINNITTVFICMGGSDPFHMTTKALKACLGIDFITRIIIVTGIGYCDQSELDSVIKSNRTKYIIHKSNIDASMMISLLNESEIAICPSSGIALEVCCVKVGLLCGTVIENQDGLNRQLAEDGCCISLGNLNYISITELISVMQQFNDLNFIRTMMNRQSKKIDGKSGDRIVKLFKQLSKQL